MRLSRSSVLLLVAAVSCAALSAHNLQGAYLSVVAERQSEATVASLPRSERGELLSFPPEADEALRASLRAARHSYAVTDIHRAAEWLGEKARLSQDSTEKLAAMCEQLSLFGLGSAQSPRDSRLLLGWAAQRQLLGQYSCQQPFTAGSVSEAVDRALFWNPWSHEVLLWAARLTLAEGRRAEGVALLSRLLRYSNSINPGQELEVLQQISSASEFETVVPAKVPQITKWSARMRERRAESFLSWQPQISNLQRAAIEDARERMESQELPPDLFEAEVRALGAVAASDDVRQRVDAQLYQAALRRGATEEAQFFEQRARLQMLRVVPAQAASDTRPMATSLVRWGGSQSVALDYFYQTLGFYLPPRQGVSMIVLRAQVPRESLNLGALRLLVSDDNERWLELSPQRMQRIVSGAEELVIISVATEGQRYWKIHFDSPVRRGQFGGVLDELLSVYGNAAGTEESLG